MCLNLTKSSKCNTKRIKSRSSSNIVVYKLVRKGKDGFYSIFQKNYSTYTLDTYPYYKYVLGQKFISTRQNTKLCESFTVVDGCHVFLRNNKMEIKKVLDYIKNNCGQQGPFVLLKCVANRNCLVTTGKWDETGLNCAVFTKITPIEAIEIEE